MIGIALIVWGVLVFSGFREWLRFQREILTPKDLPQQPPEAAVEDLRADINRIKLMLNIRTFGVKEGEKK